jgi:hypothetical protein
MLAHTRYGGGGGGLFSLLPLFHDSEGLVLECFLLRKYENIVDRILC